MRQLRTPDVGRGLPFYGFEPLQLCRAVGQAVARQQSPFVHCVRGHTKQQRFRAPNEIFALDTQQAQVDFLGEILHFGPIADPLRKIALEVAIVALNDPLQPRVLGRLSHCYDGPSRSPYKSTTGYLPNMVTSKRRSRIIRP